MPRKLRFATKKSHSSKGDKHSDQDSIAVQTDTVELFTTGVQTDTVEVCTTAVQTEIDHQESGGQHLLTPLPNSLIISIPLQYYLSIKLESVTQLSKCVRSMKCIENWFVLSCDLESNVKLVKVCEKIVITLEVTANMQWFVSFPSVRIECADVKFNGLPSVITSIIDLQTILRFLNEFKLCLGVADPRFGPVTSKCKGVFRDKSGKFLLN